uniref:Uncharacterized protein n=1 Tax=Medicago truncatula TaxID=3880 RepID=Q2HT62_MEDTR|nr:hypothetical protein MtrDRAFT_AC150777g19v1 [Medicago truncatula]
MKTGLSEESLDDSMTRKRDRERKWEKRRTRVREKRESLKN